MKYLVEVASQTIIPVTIVADSEQEAIEYVLSHQGDAGEAYPGRTEVITIGRLEE